MQTLGDESTQIAGECPKTDVELVYHDMAFTYAYISQAMASQSQVLHKINYYTMVSTDTFGTYSVCVLPTFTDYNVHISPWVGGRRAPDITKPGHN